MKNITRTRWGLVRGSIFSVMVVAVLVSGFFIAIPQAFAATITSTQNGNWNSAGTWAAVSRTGTIAYTNGSTAVTGTGTSFTTQLAVGSIIITNDDGINGGNITRTVASITNNTNLTLTENSNQTKSGKTFTAQVVPLSGDTVTVATGDTITVDSNAAATSLSFTQGATLTSTVTINPGIALNISGAVTIPRNTTSGVNTLAVGAGTLNAGSIAFTNGGTTVRHQITISTGNVTITGDVSEDTAGDTSPTISFSGAGNLNLGGALWSGGGGTLTTFTGSTVNYNGSAQTVKAITYSNLILSGSGAKSMATGTSTNGNLSIAPTGSATASVGTGLNLSVNSLTLGGLGTINGTWGYGPTPTYKDTTHFANTTGYLTVGTGTRGSQAPLTVTGLPASATYRQAGITVNTSGGSGTGAVTFATQSSTACSVTPTGAVTITSGTGTCSIVATKSSDGNYNTAPSDPVPITINKATAVIVVTPYSVTYNSLPHTATGTATGVLGEDLSANFNLSGTTHTEVGSYPTDAWSFAGGTNYNNASGTVADAITPDYVNLFIGIHDSLVAGGIANNIDTCGATPTACSSLYFEKVGYGKITFSSLLDLTDSATQTFLQNLGSHLNIADEQITLDVATATALQNKGATLEMYSFPHGVGVDDVTQSELVVKNDSGVVLDPSDPTYPAINGFAWNNSTGTVSFGVSHFTGFFLNDTIKPFIVSFSISPATQSSLTVSGITVTAHDNRGLDRVMFTESSTPPSDWSSSSSYGAPGYSYIFGSAGSHTLYAWVKDGSGNVSNAYDGKTVTITLPKTDQTITFDALDAKTYGDPDFSVSATGGDSGNPVTFSVTAESVGVCTSSGTNGSTITITGAGTCTVQADQAGDSSYNAALSVQQAFTVSKATSTTIVTCPASPETYNGSPLQPCSALVTGVGGLNTDTIVNYTDNTNVGTANASATFAGDNNHSGSSDVKTFTINRANAIINITPYSVTYDGNPHTAIGTATGVGEDGTLSGLDLSGTTHTAAGTYATDPWTFTDVTGNYNNALGTVDDAITKADANISVTPYDVAYDSASHTAVGTASGVESPTPTDLSSLLTLSGTMHTDVGNYSGDVWIFAGNDNYNSANSTVNDNISKATAVCTISGYSGTYDSAPHGASGSCVGVGGPTDILSGLDLGSSFTYVPGGTASWTFENLNYNSESNTVPIEIVALSLTGSFTADNKVYDDNDSATVLTRSLSEGVISPDDVSLTGGTATFGTANAEVGKTVTLVGATLGGADAGNYHLDSVDTTTADISKVDAVIVVTPYSVAYDGTSYTAAGTATGVLGESLAGLDLSGTTHTAAGTYATDPWTFTDVTGNYNNALGTVDDAITTRPITVTAVTNTKPFDGNTTAAGLPTITSGTLAAGDTGNFTETYDTATVGTGKTLTPAGTVTTDSGATDVTVNYDISFVPDTTGVITAVTHTITASTGGHGSISPSGSVLVDEGSDQTFTITPNGGYQVADVTVDSVSEGSITSYTFTGVTGDHTITASFSAIPVVTVTVIAATGGSAISADTAGGAYTSLTGPVMAEDSVGAIGMGTIVLDAPAGFEFDTGGIAPTVLVTRTTGTGTNSKNINNLASGSTIAVTSSATQLTITILSPTQGNVKNSLTWQDIRVRPTAATPLASGDIAESGTSTFNADTSNYGTLVEVAGTSTTVTLTYTAGANGSIEGTSPQTVDQGSNGSEITAVPDPDFHFTSWTDGVLTASRTDADVQDDISVTANFVANQASDKDIMEFNFPEGTGVIDGINIAVTVPSGTDVTALVATFNTTGASVTVGEIPQVSGATVNDFTEPVTYTVTAEDASTQDYTVTVTIAPQVTHTITASAGDHGSISPSGEVSVNDGNNQSFTVSANEGYHVADVIVDGESVGALTSYTFTEVTGNHTISASFSIDESRDTTAPTIVPTINATGPTTVVVTFDEDLQNNESGHHPAPSDFRVYNGASFNGENSYGINGVSYSNKIVTITLTNPILAGDNPHLDILETRTSIVDLSGNFFNTNVTYDHKVYVAPVITEETAPATSVTTTSITVTWTTDHNATSRVIYDTTSHSELGVAPNYGYANSTGTSDEDPMVTSHSVVVSGLSSGTTYFLRTVSHGSPESVSSQLTGTTTAVSSGGGGVVGLQFLGNPTPSPTPAPGQVLGAATANGDPLNLTQNGLHEGEMISTVGSNDPDVYIVNTFGFKRLFLNPTIFNFYGHLGGWAKVKHITALIRDLFPTSGLFRNCETNDPKVYAVEITGEDTGTLHWVNMTGAQAVAEDANFFKKVFCVNSNEFNWYAKSSVDFTSLAQLPMYSR